MDKVGIRIRIQEGKNYPQKKEKFKTLGPDSVADPGSGAFLTLGSGIGLYQIQDPGSQTHVWELSDNFLGKKFYT